MRLPRAQPGHGEARRRARLHHDAGGRRLGVRVAEIGLLGALAAILPAGKIILEQLFGQRRVDIAGNRNHRVFRAIPALMEGFCLGRGHRVERCDRADRRMVSQGLAGKEMLATGVGNAHLRTVALAPFGQHHRPLGIDRAVDDIGVGHHAGQDLQAFAKARLIGLRQVERIGGAGRRGRGIAVAAKGDAQPLPDALRLAIGHMARPAHRQMFHEMGIALLIGTLHQRSGIDAQADRHLPWRHAVAADGIAQPVGQRAEPPRRVDRHITIFVEPGADIRLAAARRGLCPGDRRIGSCRQRQGRARQKQGQNGERSGRTARGQTHRQGSLTAFS